MHKLLQLVLLSIVVNFISCSNHVIHALADICPNEPFTSSSPRFIELSNRPISYIRPSDAQFLDGAFKVLQNDDSPSKQVLVSSIDVNRITSPVNPRGAEFDFSINDPTNVYLWGYFYFVGSGNDGNSFWATIQGNGVNKTFKFGNDRDKWYSWHWDGDGNTEFGPPLPLHLGYLNAGEYTIIISERENTPEAPLIGALALTTEKSYTPSANEAICHLYCFKDAPPN